MAVKSAQPMSLSRTVIHSGLWLQTSKLLQLAASFVVTAVLARLLTPQDFGLIGIVTVITAFILIFTDIGFGAAIIQRQEITDRQLSTLYWINFLLGLGTALVIVGTSGLAARFYGYPDLIPLLWLASTNFLLSPFIQVHRKIMEKRLLFPTLSRINLISALGSGLVGIGCAYAGFGVYSLVFQTISLTSLNALGIRLSFRWRPQYTFSWRAIRDLFFFSIKVKGAQLSRYLEKHIDMFVLGKMLSAGVFGFYSLAIRIVNIPIRRICSTFVDILFPSFSVIQDDLKKVKIGYLKSVQLIAIFIFPFILTIGLYARPLVLKIFGEQWLPVADILFILSLVGGIQSIELLSMAIYPAINRPEVSFKLGVIRTIVTGLAVLIGGSYGLTGAAVAILISKSLLFMVSMIWLKRYIKFSFYEILKYLAGPLLGMSVMAIISTIFNLDITVTIFKLSMVLIFSFALYSVLILWINFKDLKYIFVRLSPKT